MQSENEIFLLLWYRNALLPDSFLELLLLHSWVLICFVSIFVDLNIFFSISQFFLTQLYYLHFTNIDDFLKLFLLLISTLILLLSEKICTGLQPFERKSFFMSFYLTYPGECPLYVWEECVFCAAGSGHLAWSAVQIKNFPIDFVFGSFVHC